VTRRPGWVVLDLVAVLVLVALAVVGLSTTFGGWGFLVVAEAAAALGLLIALATVRLPVAVLAPVAPLGAILLGGPVALRSEGLGGGVPDGQTLSDVMQGSGTGWGELLTTLPHVDLAGPPALVPFLLGYGGGLLGGALALRSRSAAGPALPLLAVLVGTLLVRRPPEGLLAWHPVGCAVTAVAWVALRGLQFTDERSDEIRGNAHGRVLRGVLATVVVGAALLVAVPLTSGNATAQGETLRGRIGELPDVTDLDSPLRNFRAYTKQDGENPDNLNAKVLLTVEGAPSDARLRLLTLDRYDGRSWVADNETMTGTSEDRFLRMDTEVENHTVGRAIRVQVGIKKAYRSAWVPTMGSLTSLRFLFADAAESRRNELRYDVATSTAVIPIGLAAGNDYEFTAVLPDSRLDRNMQPWPAPVIEVAGIEGVDPLIPRVLASKAPPMRKVFALAAYLRENGYYSNGSGPAEQQYRPGNDSKRIIEDFLLSRQMVGDDEQYAAAMAILANRVGVPARVVVGALVPAGGKVRGADVQVWVELRVADGSWRTLPTPEFMGRRPPESELQRPPLPNMPVGAAAPAPPTAPPPPEVTQQEQAQDAAAAARRSLVVRMLPWLVPLLLVGVIPLTKLVRRWRRRTRGRRSDRMAGAWTELVDHARDLGIPVRTHASRPAQARVLARAGALSRQGDEGVFAEQEPDEEVVEAYWEQVMGERRTLGEGQQLHRRLWALFNPVTLVRRPGSD
jgi:transglutaminase-like putative cysteine protease